MANALMWTVYEMADRPAPGGGFQILGTEMRSMAWPRSVRRMGLLLVGDQFFQGAFSLSEIEPSDDAAVHHWLVRASATRDCNNPWFSKFLAQVLPADVLYGCPSISLLCFTWVSWPKREVFHSVSVRRRSATSMTLTWVPPSDTAAVLQLAQNQWRVGFVGVTRRRPPSPMIPGQVSQA